MTRPALFVVLEGPDGVGKSTLAAALTRGLEEKGVAVELKSFPGREKATLGELVYRLHHNKNDLGVAAIEPAALQAMHIASHIDAIESTLRPSLQSGVSIVLDRYWWSTEVYGVTSGISEELLRALVAAENVCWGDTKPHVIFFIDVLEPWRVGESSATWQEQRCQGLKH
jgi:dTMP kinase